MNIIFVRITGLIAQRSVTVRFTVPTTAFC